MRDFQVRIHTADLIRFSEGIEECRPGAWLLSGGQSDPVWISGPSSVPVNQSLPALQSEVDWSLCRGGGGCGC